jgi:hypothetical protein
MKKPVRPTPPNLADAKYNQPGGPVQYNKSFSQDYKIYLKEFAKYKIELESYEQNKMLEDIKRSSIKLCLKKYKITKK